MERRQQLQRLLTANAHCSVRRQRWPRSQVAFERYRGIGCRKDSKAGYKRLRLAARCVKSLRSNVKPRQPLAPGMCVRSRTEARPRNRVLVEGGALRTVI